MTKSMTVTYEVDTGLYVNVTNKCTNRCEFCIRNNGDGAYGSDSLWLEREPSAKEILDSILSRDLSKYSEIVFCGYGEPTMRLAVCRSVALEVKKLYPDMRIRINTNGHSDLILGMDTAWMYEGAFDTVSISLNTPTREGYTRLCHPAFGASAFDALLTLATNLTKKVPEVMLSVVRETLTEDELAECRRLADSAGVYLKVRTYIGA